MTVEQAGAAPPGCRLLECDSDFFGCRIARLEPEALTVWKVAQVEAWCARERIDCLHVLIDVCDQVPLDAARDLGFRFVDLRVTLDAQAGAPVTAGPLPGGFALRTAAAGDIEALKAIAHGSYPQTRFYVDGRFDRARCDALYETWIEKSCRGWADRVIVIDAGSALAGFVTCHRGKDAGSVGLVGVDASFRGRGVGLALLAEARRWFEGEGSTRVQVITQGRNTGGLRLYQKAGFSVRTLQLWFHKWLKERDDV